MQIKHSITIMIMALGTMLISCQQDRMTEPDAIELYTRNFIKQFGVADPNHDWNMATKGNVSVTTSTPTHVKVYAMVNGKRYIFADYQNVNGTKEIEFDIPKGINKLIVRANGIDYDVDNGGRITIGKTAGRFITDPGSSTDNKLTWSISRERMLSTSALDQYINIYNEEEPNLGKGTTSFYFIADGKEHTFYPFFWFTSAKHSLGIYYIPDDSKPDEIVMQDLYFTKTGELLANGYGACNPTISADLIYKPGNVHMFRANYYTCNEWAEVFPGFRTTLDKYKNSTEQMQHWVLSDGKKLGDINDANGTERIYQNAAEADFITDNGFISRIRYNNYTFVVTETVTKEYKTPKAFERNGFNPVNTSGEAYKNSDFICSRGITYKLETGVKYGFYLKVNKNKTGEEFYTEENGIKKPKDIKDQPYDFIVFSQASRNQTYVDTKKNGDKDVNAVIRDYNWKHRDDNAAAPDWWKDGHYTDKDLYAYASWGTVSMGGKTYTMFGFEDWDAHTNNVGPDLNDLMFIFDTGMAPSNIVNEHDDEGGGEEDTPFEWLIAAEDLGNVACDWDFNDMVVKISTLKVSDASGTYTKVKIEPLAAGGTLPIYLMYTGKIGKDETAQVANYMIGEEFHSWFGLQSLSPINVAKGSTATPIAQDKIIDIEVPASFSMQKHVGYGVDNETGISNMGGFWFIVNRQTDTEAFSPVKTGDYTKIETLPSGKTPPSSQHQRKKTMPRR